MRRLPLLLVILPLAAAWAGKSDAIAKLEERGRVDDAVEKCDKWDAAADVNDPSLRSICARLVAPRPDETDLSAIRAFVARWKGTPAAKEALVQEATVAFNQLGDRPRVASIDEYLAKYAAAPEAAKAKAMLPDAQLREIATPAAAVQFVLDHPTHPRLHVLVAQYPEAFVRVVTRGDQALVRLEPEVILPPELQPSLAAVVKLPDGSTKPYAAWAVEAAERAKVPAALRGAASSPLMPRCADLPSAELTPGFEATLGTYRVVVPTAWNAACGPDREPMWLAFQKGALISVHLSADRVVSASAFDDLPAGVVKQLGPVTVSSAGLWRALPPGAAFVPWQGGAAVIHDRPPEVTAALAADVGDTPELLGWTQRTDRGSILLARDGVERRISGADQVRGWSPLATQLVLRASELSPLRAAPPLDVPSTQWTTDRMGYLANRAPRGGRDTPCLADRAATDALAAATAAALGLPSVSFPRVCHAVEPGDGATITLATFEHQGSWMLAVRVSAASGTMTRVWAVPAADTLPNLYAFTMNDHVYLGAQGTYSPGYDHFASYAEIIRIGGGSIGIEYVERWI